MHSFFDLATGPRFLRSARVVNPHPLPIMPRHPLPEEDDVSVASDLSDSDTLEDRIGKAITAHQKLESIGENPKMMDICRRYRIRDSYHTFRNRLLKKHTIHLNPMS